MKAFTDIEQSKKLAEILPIESVDMWFANGIVVARDSVNEPDDIKSVIPCWSLAALLDVLPDSIYDNTHEFSQLEFTKKSVAYMHGATDGIKIGALKDNLVDACYEMIIKLHEQNIL